MTTGNELRAARESAEVSLSWLSQKIGLSKSHLSRIERGEREVTPAILHHYRKALAEREVLVTATATGHAGHQPSATGSQADRKDFLHVSFGAGASVAATSLAALATPIEPTSIPSVVGATDIDEVRTVARAFASWDHTYGGGMVRDAVAVQLRYAVRLLEARCPDQQRSSLYSAVGFLGHTSGFMAFDAYAFNDAIRLFRLALICAEEAQDWHLRAKVLSSMSRQATWRGDPDEGLTLVEMALVRADRLTSTERAMLYSARARALAKLGRSQETLTSIGKADEQFSQSSPVNDPPWMKYYDAAQHEGDTGHALWDSAIDSRDIHRLSRGVFLSEASARLARAVAGHTDAYARSRAISGIKLASLTMAMGDPQEATELADYAIRDADQIRSRRARDDLQQLREFAAVHEHISEVAELRHQIGRMVGAS